ncbi:OmpH family outer membrane protein [Wenzhouxiangella sp. XN79A]|uniref:OmpH family outer membrane protein n=1 Tax=Wenzhouxiangella sp. XN79A TaxID=2724193 RepID=UPI00144AA77D|nr:OmpH family outer membrane protein [Wenzhouxiangella sp. XN79A]NKI35006.1 OmpH family outer membrane protein [Wenzhouxiangella sp. XN79A]
MARALTLLLALMLAGPAWGQADVRIGYVDMKRLLDNAPQVLAGRAELDIEFRPRNEALLADEQRLVDMEQALADSSGLSNEQLLAREREIRNLRRSIDRRREDLADELNFRRNAEIKSLGEEIELAVQTVARREGYDLVLSSPVAFASDRIDITDQVLEFLEVDFELRSRRERQ